jgi:hypothetical protein
MQVQVQMQVQMQGSLHCALCASVEMTKVVVNREGSGGGKKQIPPLRNDSQKGKGKGKDMSNSKDNYRGPSLRSG